MTHIKPDNADKRPKKEQVAEMFDLISHRYDFLNHFFSVNSDKRWRRRVVLELKKYSPRKILDVATGTGDFAIELATLNPEIIAGIDISGKMLEIARQKIKKKNLEPILSFQQCDAENITFPDSSFDAVTVAFGVRNFGNMQQGINEMFRVLRQGGVLAVLEFSKPRNVLIKGLYYFYFTMIMPLLGRLVSGHKKAYRYLPESVLSFPEREEFAGMLQKAGFSKIWFLPLSAGIVTLYLSEK